MGCSSSTAQGSPPATGAQPERPVAVDAAVPDGATQAEAPRPWGLDRDGLAQVVIEGASARLREVQPDLDLARLPELVAHPDTAPALSGRACDQLTDLAVVALAQGRLDEAAGLVRLVRAKARNRNLAFVGSTLLSEVARRQAGADEAAQERAIEGVLAELPRARFGGATVVFQLIQTRAQVDARLAQVSAQLRSQDTARAALYYREILPEIVAHRPRFLAAVERVRAAQAAQPAQAAYSFGTVDLTGNRGAREVRVAVWDLGTNPALFEGQLFNNPREQANGRDDDGNGQVDDLHGIVADGSAANTALLYEPGAETLSQYGNFLRGVMDLRAGLSTSEAAQQVLALQRGITTPEAQETLDNGLDAVGEWAHGTHVAGILLQGIPQARLAIFRSAWAGEHRPYHHRGPSDAELDQERQNIDAIAAFINRHNIRVVNASLGFTLEYVEDELRHESAQYHNDDEVRARARVIQARRRENWQSIFRACPSTLFVVSAGNSNQDVVEYGVVPGGVAAPNVLSVGAVDRYGQWATFTNSNPEQVQIFDHGVEVDSVIPNGSRLPLSGTSMASPNAANLAAKVLSLAPQLAPAQVIALMVASGDPIAAPFNGRIANETRAIEYLRTRPASYRVAPARAPARR